MNKCEILVICRHPEILATIVRLINNNADWNATGCETDEAAISAFEFAKHTIVLIGAGVDSVSEKALSQAFIRIHPQVKIVQHYGGGSGLLSAEIFGALDKP